MASSSWSNPPPAMTWLFRRFPLVCHPSQLVEGGSAPLKPTLWILGRPNANGEPSFDVRSLRRQAELRFRGVECEVKTWENEDGGVEGRLPALHLPDGSLLADHAIDAWLDKRHPVSSDAEVSSEAAAWYALIETKLFPALTAHLFVEPLFESYTLPRYHPRSRSATSPLLSRLVHSIVGSSHRATALANVRAIIGGSGAVDLEDLEAEAGDALDALAQRMGETGATGWFLGTDSPLALDAALFAHLHAILTLPSLKTESPNTTNRLRAAVERHDSLVQWMRRLERKYFDA